MPSVLSIHGRDLRVHENRDEVMQRIMWAEAQPISEGGNQSAPLGWVRLSDMGSSADVLIQASAIGYVRHDEA